MQAACVIQTPSRLTIDMDRKERKEGEKIQTYSMDKISMQGILPRVYQLGGQAEIFFLSSSSSSSFFFFFFFRRSTSASYMNHDYNGII